MTNFKAVIFDLDGTLVDSLADLADSVNAMLLANNYTAHDYRSYKFFVGNGFRNLVEKCLPQSGIDQDTFNRCHGEAMAIYEKKCLDKSSLYEGVAQLLDQLTERGVKLSVLSNKPDDLTQKISNVLLDRWSFDVILGSSDRFPRKPDPASARFVARSMNANPSEIVYVGDSDVDMKTAIAAGFYPVGVSWGFRPVEELETNGARMILDKPQQLLELFNDL